METGGCLPLEMAVNIPGTSNQTLIMLDSGTLHSVEDTVALAAAHGIKLEETEQLEGEQLVMQTEHLESEELEPEQLGHDQLTVHLENMPQTGMEPGMEECVGEQVEGEIDTEQPHMMGINPQFINANGDITVMTSGEQCLRLINPGEHFPEGSVAADGSLLSQAYIPIVLDGDSHDSNLAVTAQIMEDQDGRRMIVLAPNTTTADPLQQVHMIESQPEIVESPSAELSQPSLELHENTIELGQSGLELGQSGLELGQPSIELGQPNMELGQPSMELGQPSMELGQPSIELGGSESVIEQTIPSHDEQQNKRIKLEEELTIQSAPMYILTAVSENGETVAEAQEEVSVRTTPLARGPGVAVLKNTPPTVKAHHNMDVTQAWFTTKDDKVALQSKGHNWRQGQWTKEEVEMLEHNIASYCVDHQIEDPTDVIFQFSKEERKDFYRNVAKGLQRPLFSVYRRVIRMYDQKNHIGKYTPEEILKLKELRTKHGSDWATIGASLGRSASSVKDRCRLMKETCNQGKWLPEEERLLAQAVYELSGCEPGDSVTKGLSWAQVAERVGTRSEKQCRTKWLNYLNWKQLGGTEWTREDDILLISKLIVTGASDETQVDWNELSENWPSARSPQWLRGKWWSLKRHVPEYQSMLLQDLLELVKKISFPIKAHVKAPHISHSVAAVQKLNVPVLSNMTLAMTMSPAGEVLATNPMGVTTEVCDGTIPQEIEGYSHYSTVMTTQPQGAFLIAQPPGNPAVGLQAANIPPDHIIVHALPFNQDGVLHTGNVLGDPNVAMQLQQQVIITTEAGQTVVTSEPMPSIPLQMSAIQHPDHDYHPLHQSDQIVATSVTEIDQSELELQSGISNEAEIMSDGVDLSSQIGGSEITSDVTQSDLEGHVTIVSASSASSQLVNNDFIQNMSSYSDPMLPLESSDLIGSSSDVETDKVQTQ